MREDEQNIELTSSIGAIRKSGRVIYAFLEFYLPFYNLNPRFVFLENYDLFGGLSAAIYDLDEDVERFAHDEEDHINEKLDRIESYIIARIGRDQYIHERLREAREYYNFENKLKLRRNFYSLDDLARVTEIRSFDFRILHRIVSKTEEESAIGWPFTWLRSLEILMELEDDLFSIETDVERRSFNFPGLAMRTSHDAGISFYKAFRNQNLTELQKFAASLSTQQKDICDRVFGAYRSVVADEVITSRIESLEDVRCHLGSVP
jgi:hypothetical protein